MAELATLQSLETTLLTKIAAQEANYQPSGKDHELEIKHTEEMNRLYASLQQVRDMIAEQETPVVITMDGI